MNSDALKKCLLNAAKRHGKSELRRLLVIEGLSPHTTDKILGGRYDCEIGALAGAAIKRVLEALDKQAS